MVKRKLVVEEGFTEHKSQFVLNLADSDKFQTLMTIAISAR